MKKFILAVLAVFLMSGIASAATTLDLKGYVRVYPEANNFGTSAGNIPDYLLAKAKSGSHAFTDQRARLYFNVKSNENLGGTVALEIDSRWGNTSYDNGRGTGGGLGADTNNIEVKNSYLWFKTGSLRIMGGIQTYGDDMAGIFVGGGDMAGFRADYTMSKTSSLTTGAFVWWDRNTRNTDSVYFIPLTLKQQLGGGSATLFLYTIQDNSSYQAMTVPNQGRRPLANAAGTQALYEKAEIYYAGLNYGGKAGNISYYLMGAYNFGTFKDVGVSKAASTGDAKISAFAANAKVDVKIGDGKLRLNGLYVSGTDPDPSKYSGFVTGDQYAGANTMTLLQDDLVIIINNTDAISNVTVLANDVNNNGDGVQMAYGAFDYNLTPKLNAKAVIGYAAADKKNLASRKGKGMGAEYNAQLKYKFDDNLTIGVVASYAQIGDYFNTATFDADNAYKLLLKFGYSF